jgi:hypothetical protein
MTAKKQSKLGPAGPAQDPEASPETLLSLLDKDGATNRLLARHPKASADLLEKLSHSSDKATRQAVASNPNTPPPTLVRLGQQFPKEFLANPALDLLLMVSPDLIEQAPEAFLIRLLKQADCPASLLDWAASHSEAKVQLAVAMNAKAPEQALEKLLASKHPSVLETIRSRDGLGLVEDSEKAFEQAVRERLGSLPIEQLHEAWDAGDIGLAHWSALPLRFRLPVAQEALFEGSIAGVLSKTSWNVESLNDLLPDFPWWEVAGDSDSPVPILAALAKHSGENVRRRVAQNSSLPVSLLEALTDDSEAWVRAGVASNPSTPSRFLQRLANDSGDGVRQAVAENPSTPGHVLEALANESGYGLRAGVAGNPSTPVHVLEVLATDSAELVVRRVAGNPSTPAAVLEVLAPEFGRGFWQEVAGNPSAPAPVLDLLAKNALSKVRESVAAHPSTPATALEALGNKDSESSIRIQVARNSATSVPLLAELAEDPLDSIRAGVASNSSTPVSILERLAKDRSKEVLKALIRNSNCPFPLLSTLVKAKDATVREAFAAAQAQHSDQCIRTLWADDSERVRHALAGNQKLSPELLDELAQSAELERDKAALLRNKRLSVSTAQKLADKLLTTEPTASAWYQQQLLKAKPEVAQAAKEGRMLSYFGKDPNKAALAKRSMASVMALCSGPLVEPSRIVRLAGSSDWLIRAAVARNRGTPENLLKKLGADVNPLVASLARETQRYLTAPLPDEAKRSDSGFDISRAAFEVIERARKFCQMEPESLTHWVMDDVWSDRIGIGECLSILVRYEPGYVFPSILERLDAKQVALLFEEGATSLDAEVRQFLARDQACPAHVFNRLERDAEPKVLLAALCNPTLPISNRPYFLKSLFKLRGQRLKAVFKEEAIPTELLEHKVRSRGGRYFLANSTATPKAMLELLATDSNEWVRVAVSRNPTTPPPALDVLAKDSNEVIRCDVALNRSAPESALERLAKDTDERIRAAVASNPTTPMSVLVAFAEDASVRVRRDVSGNRSTPTSVLECLASDAESGVRAAVARNPTTPSPTLASLAKDLIEEVRESVAGNTSTSALALECLANDSAKGVRDCVAKNSSAPVSTRASLVSNLSDRARARVAEDQSTPTALLEALAKDSDVSVRAGLARNPSTATSVLDSFAKDSSEWVRVNVAANPSTPASVLEALADNPDHSVRIAVAGNPAVPASALERLAKSSDVELLRSIAANTSSTKEFRDRYAEGWAMRLVRAIQRESCIHESNPPEPQVPLLPVDLLRGLEWLGLLYRDEDNKSLTKASRSMDWLTRLGVALHPSATEGILKLLRMDCDADVARAANTPKHVQVTKMTSES